MFPFPSAGVACLHHSHNQRFHGVMPMRFVKQSTFSPHAVPQFKFSPIEQRCGEITRGLHSKVALIPWREVNVHSMFFIEWTSLCRKERLGIIDAGFTAGQMSFLSPCSQQCQSIDYWYNSKQSFEPDKIV